MQLGHARDIPVLRQVRPVELPGLYQLTAQRAVVGFHLQKFVAESFVHRHDLQARFNRRTWKGKREALPNGA